MIGPRLPARKAADDAPKRASPTLRERTGVLTRAFEHIAGRDSARDAASDAGPHADPRTLLRGAWAGVRRHVGLVVLFSAAINLLYLSPSIFMLQIYDRVLPSHGLLTLGLISFALVLALGAMSLLDAARSKLLARASLRIERIMAGPVMQEMLAARRGGNASATSGIRDLDAIRGALASPAALGLIDLPWTPLFILVCFMIHFWVGLLALAGSVLILGIALLNERSARAALLEIAARTVQFQSAHDSDVAAAETIHALGAENAMTARRLATRSDLADAQMDAALATANYSAFTRFARQILQSAALGLGAWLAIERQISPGAIVACSILTARAYAPIELIVAGWRQIGLAIGGYRNLDKLLQGARAPTDRTPLPTPEGHIRAEGVFVTAPGTNIPVLNNATFAASPGEVVAIVGPSGAGKTALARVLANATAPRSGAVRIDGARYSDWDPEVLARHIGYLPQRIELFDGTVAENIARFERDSGADPAIVGAKVVEAARLANAHDLILSLPNGYETRLGRGGGGVSPGQAQRIALARALYGPPVVTVLDEPNAHLDAEGDAALTDTLLRCKERGMLSFVVAHRTGVLTAVDRIIVLARGQIAMVGPRDEVLGRLARDRGDEPPRAQVAS